MLRVRCASASAGSRAAQAVCARFVGVAGWAARGGCAAPSLAASRAFSSKRRIGGGDGSSVRRIRPNHNSDQGFREITFDGEEGQEEDGEQPLSAEDEQLWTRIAKHQQPRPPQSTQSTQSTQSRARTETEHSGSQQQADEVDTARSSYTAYRPYSDPRSANLAEAGGDSAPAGTPAMPKYSSSRQTPAQLAWKAGQQASASAGANAADEASSSSAAPSNRREMTESRDASARSRYAARHGLGRAQGAAGDASSSDSAWPSPSRAPPATGEPRADAWRGFQGVRSSNSSDASSARPSVDVNRSFATRRNEDGFRERVGTFDERRGRDDSRRARGWPSSDGWSSGGRASESSWSVKDAPSDYWRDRSDSFRGPRNAGAFRGAGERRDSGFDRRPDSRRQDRFDDWPRDREQQDRPRFNDGFRGRPERGSSRDRDSFRSADAFEGARGSDSGSSASACVREVEGELLYGFHPVVSALIARKRAAFHRLYLQENKAERIAPPDSQQQQAADDDAPAVPRDRQLRQVLDLARRLELPISYVPKHALNVAAGNRPHNGFLLDAAHLETPLIHAPRDLAGLMDEQAEGQIWLLLDEVMDPQNLGAMLRSAFYFGVHGVLVCSKNSAPLSAVTSKASSGAQETLHLVAVASTPRLLHKLKEEDWNIVGLTLAKNSIDLRQLADTLHKRDTLPAADAGANADGAAGSAAAGSSFPRRKHTLLVVGNEGKGLRPVVAQSCHVLAKIVASTARGGLGPISEADTALELEHVQAPALKLQHDAHRLNEEEEAELLVAPPAPEAAKPATARPAHVFVDSLNVSNALAVALYELTRAVR